MSPRMLAFGALVVAGSVLALFVALRQGEQPVRQGRPGAAAHAARTRPAALAPATAGPARPSEPRASPPDLRAVKPEALGTTGPDDAPLWTEYDDEERDPSWATAKERAIHTRLDALLESANHAHPGAVQVPQVECREVHCRLLVTGTDERAFRAFVESLQDERGFYGDAALLALDGYSESVDKRTGRPHYQVRVHLKYDR